MPWNWHHNSVIISDQLQSDSPEYWECEDTLIVHSIVHCKLGSYLQWKICQLSTVHSGIMWWSCTKPLLCYLIRVHWSHAHILTPLYNQPDCLSTDIIVSMVISDQLQSEFSQYWVTVLFKHCIIFMFLLVIPL